jgi:hypothetical protein
MMGIQERFEIGIEHVRLRCLSYVEDGDSEADIALLKFILTRLTLA